MPLCYVYVIVAQSVKSMTLRQLLVAAAASLVLYAQLNSSYTVFMGQ